MHSKSWWAIQDQRASRATPQFFNVSNFVINGVKKNIKDIHLG